MSEPTAVDAQRADIAPGAARAGRRVPLVAAFALVFLILIPLGLTVRAGWAPLLDLDESISNALVVPGRGLDVDILRVLTAPGLMIARLILILPVVAWLAMARRWQLVAFVVVGGLAVTPVNRALKAIFDRDRPSIDDTILMGGQSFPSGHSSGAAALAAVLVVVAWPVLVGTTRRILVVLAAVGMVVVGYTRLALGAHFPSDVLAGWAVGVAWVLLVAVALDVWPGRLGALPTRQSAAHP